MSIQGAQIGFSGSCPTTSTNCTDKFGCTTTCPDFTIKRHDTKPPFKVSVEDCDGPLDLTGDNLVVEVNMWANAKLRSPITPTDTYFRLADNVGFEQIMQGDIIIADRVRLPEHMLVTGFDETNYYIRVQRGYNATTPSAFKKGQTLKIFRAMGVTAEIETTLEDVLQIDGTTLEDQLSETFLVFEWDENTTCLPGCYWLEFKLLQMSSGTSLLSAASVVPSFTSSTLTPADFGCNLGTGVQWVRRFPANGEGFLIKVIDSPTMELA